MTTQAYLWGWFAYLLGCVGSLLVLWYLTRSLGLWLKLPLRTLAAVFLFMPWTVSPAHDELGPAWVVSVFDGLARDDISLWRAGAPLLGLLIGTLAVAIGVLWWQHQKHPVEYSEE